jgi:hypothetical protein
VLANHGLLKARDPDDDFAYKMTEEFVRMLRKGQPQMPPAAKLSDDAKELLLAAASDKIGRINVLKTMNMRVVHVGDRSFGNPQNAPDFARWTKAVKDLELAGFIQPINANGFYELTHEGWQAAEKIGREKGDAKGEH